MTLDEAKAAALAQYRLTYRVEVGETLEVTTESSGGTIRLIVIQNEVCGHFAKYRWADDRAGLWRACSIGADRRLDRVPEWLLTRSKRFLDQLHALGDNAARGRIGCVSSKEEEKVRAFCKKRGWIEFKPNGLGIKSWHLTGKGRVAIELWED